MTPLQNFMRYMRENNYWIGNDLVDYYWDMLKEEEDEIQNAVIYGLDEDGHTGEWKINVARKYYNDKFKKQ